MFIILVADRNKHIRELLKRELSDDGHQVILAKTAAEVVEIISTVGPIHLIIIDFELPDSDSADIMRKLKSRFDEIPVIIHSHGSERLAGFLPAHKMVEIEKGSTSIAQIKTIVDRISRGGSVSWGSDCPPGEIHTDKMT